MQQDKLWYLSKINLFADLDRDTLRKLADLIPMVTVPKGATIARPGDVDSVLYLLKRGRVRLYKLSPDGRKLTLALLGGGNVFGSTPSFGLGSGDLYAEAADSCLVCAMQEEDLRRLIHQNPDVGLRMISILSQRVRELESLVESFSHYDVQTRVLRLLLHLSEDFGVGRGTFTQLDLPLTHEEIATMIGSSRETVTTVLSALVRAGIVRTRRRSIAINRTLGSRRLAEITNPDKGAP